MKEVLIDKETGKIILDHTPALLLTQGELDRIRTEERHAGFKEGHAANQRQWEEYNQQELERSIQTTRGAFLSSLKVVENHTGRYSSGSVVRRKVLEEIHTALSDLMKERITHLEKLKEAK